LLSKFGNGWKLGHSLPSRSQLRDWK
jgi:hypothetical protein